MRHPGNLTSAQWGTLLVVRWGTRPGHSAPGSHPVLLALERRGLIQARPDPVRQRGGWMYLWTVTADGMALVDRRDAA